MPQQKTLSFNPTCLDGGSHDSGVWLDTFELVCARCGEPLPYDPAEAPSEQEEGSTRD